MSAIDSEYRATRMTIRAHLGSLLATVAVFTAIASTGVGIFKFEPRDQQERPVYYLAPPNEFVDTKAAAPETSVAIDTSSLNVSVEDQAPALDFSPIDVGIDASLSSDVRLDMEMSRQFRASSPEMGEFDTFTIYEQSEVDERPKILYARDPNISYRLRGERVEVTVFYYVTEKGRTEKQSVLYSSSENPEYGEAAVEAIKDWRFRPARKGGVSVPCWIQQTIMFSRGSSSPFSI